MIPIIGLVNLRRHAEQECSSELWVHHTRGIWTHW